MNTISNKYIAYVGTYTNGLSKGIYGFGIDTNTGEIEDLGLITEIQNPTYLTFSRDNKYLYSTIKIEKNKAQLSGGIASFSIDESTGDLKALSYRTVEGKPPCHISTDINNNYIFSAHYHEGKIISYPLNIDGTIGAAPSIIKHEGAGPNKERQHMAHVHYVSLTPDEKYLCAVDLGIDKVMLYKFHPNKGISITSSYGININKGSGPRHLAFHPKSKFAYVINELSSSITVLEYCTEDLSFKEIQHISTLPKGFSGTSYASAIHISPEGKHLYASNRGDDSIALYNIDNFTGKLQLISHFSTKGNFPRAFAIDPTGKFIFVANQNSSNIVPFAVDKDSGQLNQISEGINVPNPVCIKILPLK